MLKPAELEGRPAVEVHFGPFRLVPHERRLEKNGTAVQLGGRALDILVALVQRSGEVVSKAELSRIVWPDMIVEEGSLRFHIVSLRKALGESAQEGGGYLTTVAGRGYCFTGATYAEPADSRSPLRVPRSELPKLPLSVRRMIGMSEAVADAAMELTTQRFLTLVGPPGIGKTTLAIQLGHQLESTFPDGAAFIELGGVNGPNLVLNAVAAAIGRTPPTDNAPENLLAMLHGRKMLLIFDSCEHLIEAVADLTEQLFRSLPSLSILATSRESLRVEGEHVYRMFPLSCPPFTPTVSADEALSYAAVELFVDRLQASQIGFRLSDDEAPLVAEICRKLDGIPLALELAAGRVPAYGIRQTAALLDGHLRLLWQGRRTAPPRLQTLSAALDWSYDLLSAPERIILRRISVFVGAFTLDAAVAVASSADLDREAVVQVLANLVAKSLTVLQEGPVKARYRLLDTTRVYALAKLLASEEALAIVRRHAAFFRDLVSREDVVDIFFSSPVTTPYDDDIGNVRVALQWSFSSGGDIDLAVSLTVASAPLFLDLSLPGECHDWVEKCLAILPEEDRGEVVEMQLQAFYGLALMQVGESEDDVMSAFRRGYDLAGRRGDLYHQLRFLGGMHILLLRSGDIPQCLIVAGQARDIASALGQPVATSMAEAMLTTTHHFAGNHVQSRGHLAAAAAQPSARPRSGNMQLGVDHRSRIQGVLARDLWIRGHSLAARQAALDAIEESSRLDHPLAYNISLVFNAAVFFWLDDLPVVNGLVTRLVAHAEKHGPACYVASGAALQGILDLRQERPEEGAAKIAKALGTLKRLRYAVTVPWFLGELAECHSQMGNRSEALSAVDEALGLVARNGDHINMPELLRLKGEILSSGPVADLDGADACLRGALTWARSQCAPAWELRAAISLTRVRLEQGRPGEAAPDLEAALAGLIAPAGSKDYRTGIDLLRHLQHSAASGAIHVQEP